MHERFVKLPPERLQLHSGLPAILRSRPATDKAVNLFLDVNERLFHDAASIICVPSQSKPPGATLRP